MSKWSNLNNVQAWDTKKKKKINFYRDEPKCTYYYHSLTNKLLVIK